MKGGGVDMCSWGGGGGGGGEGKRESSGTIILVTLESLSSYSILS